MLWIGPAAEAVENFQSNSEPFFSRLVVRLGQDGFGRDKIDAIYNNPAVRFTPQKVGFLFVYRESKLNYGQFSTPGAIQKARHYIQAHQTAFSEAQKAFGVEKEIITAIIMVETKLGRYVGQASILNTLSTIAALADPKPRQAMWTQFKQKSRKLSRKKFEKNAVRKATWAYAELKAFITYAMREQIDPTQVRGSLAGAIGIAQFMPSSILAHAADGNQDGRIDLLDHSDAIASIARYLKHFGWRPGLKPKKAAKIVWRYNHSSYYVHAVLKVAHLLKG